MPKLPADLMKRVKLVARPVMFLIVVWFVQGAAREGWRKLQLRIDAGEWSLGQMQWGWLFAATPVRRRLPPMRMYHLLDYFEYRTPTREQARQIAAAGADIVIIHETWRLDVGGGSFPYCRERLREFISEGTPACKPGDLLDVNVLAGIAQVDVTGVTKGRGFAGTIKRWNYHRGPAAHGSKPVQ